MLCTFCPPTIWANSLEFSRNHLKLSADKMYRACELKDQTYKKTRTLHFSEKQLLQGPLNGGVSNGGVSRPGLVLPFLSFFVSFLGLSRFFWDFPDLLGDGPGIFPICPFPLSRPIKSTYEEQSRKGPRRNLDLSRKKWETPGFGNPPV